MGAVVEERLAVDLALAVPATLAGPAAQILTVVPFLGPSLAPAQVVPPNLGALLRGCLWWAGPSLL